MKKHFTLQNSAFNWNDSDLCNLSSGRSFLNIKLKEKNELLCQDKDWKPFALKKTLLHNKVWYFSGVFSPQYVVNASVDVFQRVLIGKMAAFVHIFTFSSGAVALYLKSWNEYTKKLCNHHSYRFHTPPGERCFS